MSKFYKGEIQGLTWCRYIRFSEEHLTPFSLPKIVFLLRSTDQTQHQDLWATFDDLIRDTLNNILGSSINDQQWAQAQLPVAMGGLGLRGAMDHSAGAYVSSVNAS